MRRFDVPMEWYSTFCDVARLGSITLAAERRFVSQPSVSMTIRQLEDRLGHTLLIRGARGVRLTPEGLVLYSYLEKALGLVETAEQKYREMIRLDSGSITIGASDTICSQYLLPYIEQFHDSYPGIGVRVTNRTSGETLDLVRSAEVDFGFVSLPIREEPGLLATACMPIHDCLIGGSRFLVQARQGLNLSQLSDYPLIMLEKTSSTRAYLQRYALSHGVELQPILELGSSDLLVKFAKIDMGLAFVVREFAREALDAQAVFEIPLTPAPPARAIGIVRLEAIPLSVAAQRFIDSIGG